MDAKVPLEITSVIIGGREVMISSPELDPWCNDEGDLILPDGNGAALIINDWRSLIRQPVTNH